MNVRAVAAALAYFLFVALCFSTQPASAVFWRHDWPTGDPAWRTQRDGLMINVARVSNGETNTFGSGVLIGDGWLLTAEHVIDTSGGGAATNPSNLTIRLPEYYGNTGLSASRIERHSSADIALVKLTNTPIDQVHMVLNDRWDEVGRTLEVGGFGRYGPAGTQQGSGSYHRARNRVDSIQSGNSDIFYDFDAPGSGAYNREGISDNGDSGGPVFISTPGDQWVLGALTRAGSSEDPVDYGKVSWALRIVNRKSWIDSIVPDVLWRTTVEDAIEGDLDFDGDVDVDDVVLLMDAHGGLVPEVLDNYDFFDDAVIDATPFSPTSDLDVLMGLSGTSYADADLDGYVDESDLSTWQSNFGSLSGGAWGMGDFNFDGIVNGLDYLVWQTDYTGPDPTDPGGGGQRIALVPEPSSLLLLSSCLVLALRIRG